MFIKLADFAVLLAALYMAQSWNDGNSHHKWILFFAVLATNLVGYIRGLNVGR